MILAYSLFWNATMFTFTCTKAKVQKHQLHMQEEEDRWESGDECSLLLSVSDHTFYQFTIALQSNTNHFSFSQIALRSRRFNICFSVSTLERLGLWRFAMEEQPEHEGHLQDCNGILCRHGRCKRDDLFTIFFHQFFFDKQTKKYVTW